MVRGLFQGSIAGIERSHTVKKYPIGIQDFRKIIEGDFLYVDKTKIIYEMIKGGSYYFLSRPRRFGKSLLLSTIKEIFSGSRELFKSLWIENHWNWDIQYPIIHVKFSSINYQALGLYNAISEDITDMASELGISLEKTELKDKFEELIQKSAAGGKVVILIDEYDKPIIDYLDEPNVASENRAVLKQFYSVIKDADQYIQFLFITGVSKFAKVSIFSDLNNLEDMTLHPSFNDIAGITQAEVDNYFSADISAIADILKTDAVTLSADVKKWYNGYNWGGDTNLYNPFSLLSFVKSQQFNNYWFTTGTPTFLVELIRDKGKFILDEQEYTSLLSLSEFDFINLDYKTILFQTGYLTISEINFPEGWCRLRYPNKEVKDSLHQFLIAAYRRTTTGESLPLVLQLRNAFENKDIEQIITLINSAFATIPSDLWKNATELHYHALVHLTFTLLGSYIQSEVNSAIGRCDAVVKTRNYIYALEFKLDETAEIALQQIKDKAYLAPYGHLPQQKIGIGINFSSADKKVGAYLLQEM